MKVPSPHTSLVTAVLAVAVIGLGVNQYIRIKAHNLNVVDSMRLCTTMDKSQKVREDCAALAKKQMITFFGLI